MRERHAHRYAALAVNNYGVRAFTEATRRSKFVEEAEQVRTKAKEMGKSHSQKPDAACKQGPGGSNFLGLNIFLKKRKILAR